MDRGLAPILLKTLYKILWSRTSEFLTIGNNLISSQQRRLYIVEARRTERKKFEKITRAWFSSSDHLISYRIKHNVCNYVFHVKIVFKIEEEHFGIDDGSGKSERVGLN